MRSGIVCALFILLLPMCFPIGTPAQSTPIVPPLLRALRPDPSSAKPQQPSKPTAPSPAASIATLQEELPISSAAAMLRLTPQQLEAPKSHLPPRADPCCAHIVIFRPSEDLDAKSLLPIPRDFASNMPLLRPSPPCPQDRPMAPAVHPLMPSSHAPYGMPLQPLDPSPPPQP